MKPEKETLQSYFNAVSTAGRLRREHPGSRDHSNLHIGLQAAKIFEIDNTFYRRLFDISILQKEMFHNVISSYQVGLYPDKEEWLTQDILGTSPDSVAYESIEGIALINWLTKTSMRFSPDTVIHLEPALKLIESLDLSSVRMPFEYLYVAGTGIQKNIQKTMLKFKEPLMHQTLGMFITRGGIWAHSVGVTRYSQTGFLECLAKDGVVQVDSSSEMPAALFYICANIMRALRFLDYVNAQSSLVMENTQSLSFKTAAKQAQSAAKVKLPIPKDYYRIDVTRSTYREKDAEYLPTGRKLSYQFSVRGHYVCRFLRGSLPLDERLEKQLRRHPNRKIIKCQSDIDEPTQQLLNERHLTYREGEWLSVLIIWRHSFTKGPKSGPYVPSIHAVK